MSLVFNASTALSSVFEDKRTDRAEALADCVVDGDLTLPEHWRLEIANGRGAAVRSKRMTPDSAAAAFARLRALAILADPETDMRAWGAIDEVSRKADIKPCDGTCL